MARAAIIALSLLVAACASPIPPATPMRDGPVVEPPLGWTGYCLANPKDPSC